MSKKQQTATQPTPAITAPASVAQPAISLDQLTPAQIAALAKQLKAQRKADMGDHKAWVEIVDKMLHEKEGDGFKNTTSDILAALQAKAIVPAALSSEARAMHIKRIQTRKQLLEKKPEHKDKVGYKPSANSFGPLDADKIVAWLQVAGNIESVTVKQAEAIHAAIKHII